MSTWNLRAYPRRSSIESSPQLYRKFQASLMRAQHIHEFQSLQFSPKIHQSSSTLLLPPVNNLFTTLVSATSQPFENRGAQVVSKSQLPPSHLLLRDHGGNAIAKGGEFVQQLVALLPPWFYSSTSLLPVGQQIDILRSTILASSFPEIANEPSS